MSRFFAAILALLASLPALAQKTQVMYEAQIIIDDEIVSRPRIVALDGEMASIQVGSKDKDGKMSEDMHLEVLPKITPEGKIETSYQLKLTHDGTTFEHKFKTVTMSGESAGLTESSSDHDFQFEVKATRQ